MPGSWWSSRAGTPPARAASSSGSPSTCRPASAGSWPCRPRPSASGRSGTSSATWPSCRRPARSPCSTAAGTTGPGSSTSWASAPPRSTTGSCASARCSSTSCIEDGIILVKYWFSVSDDEQERRFQSRVDDPLRRWKLSAIDLEARQRWSDYSRAKDAMFLHTDTPESPWYVVDAEDKRRARINCIAHLLSRVPYQPGRRGPPQAAEAGARTTATADRPATCTPYVPDYASTLLD